VGWARPPADNLNESSFRQIFAEVSVTFWHHDDR
jgi:hypothetical protein